MKQTPAYVLDLTKIDGNGAFKCPSCRASISPDDRTEKTYSILEIHVKHQDLDRVTIQCNRCGSQLRLIGFSLLHGLS
jgi:hypothetical protein